MTFCDALVPPIILVMLLMEKMESSSKSGNLSKRYEMRLCLKFAYRVTKLVFAVSVQLCEIGCIFSEGIVGF